MNRDSPIRETEVLSNNVLCLDGSEVRTVFGNFVRFEFGSGEDRTLFEIDPSFKKGGRFLLFGIGI